MHAAALLDLDADKVMPALTASASLSVPDHPFVDADSQLANIQTSHRLCAGNA
jgi:hypothetical protein